jgi:hydroxymethylglutaryl-CoA lyase
MSKPELVQLIEVGMRDGFQMESKIVPTDIKVKIGEKLIAAGMQEIEVTSFVSPKLVPQLNDAKEVVQRLRGRGARLRALAANQRGAERAIDAGVDTIVAFMSSSETHNHRNVNRSIHESMRSVREMALLAKVARIQLHGAIATAFGCPFEGEISADKSLRIAQFYSDLGITDISLGDTTGMATPMTVYKLCEVIQLKLPHLRICLHFHNTRGIAMANVLTGLELGVDAYESSFGGLGGCPFAVGATGNVCTEDLLYLLHEMNLSTGVNLAEMIQIAREIEAFFGRTLPGQVMKAGPRLSTALLS